MRKLSPVLIVLSLLVSLSFVSHVGADSSSDSDRDERSKHASTQLKPLLTAIDYHTRMIYIFNYKKDALVIVNPLMLDDWPMASLSPRYTTARPRE